MARQIEEMEVRAQSWMLLRQRERLRSGLFLCCLLLGLSSSSSAQTSQRQTSLSVLDFGKSDFAKLAAEKLRTNLRSQRELVIFDPELSRAAARGAGYSGSLNMSLAEARDLGAVMASDFYIIGDAQTLRRSPSSEQIYYESYCSVFLVSSRTGRLLFWDRPSFQAETPKAAEAQILFKLAEGEIQHLCLIIARRAQEDERSQRELIVDANQPVIEEAPDDNEGAEAKGLRLPRPYRRLHPDYPDSAARAEAEATVDVLVDVGADGEVGQVQIARWGGFGLDESTMATVRQLHFFPAMRNGVPIPLRVLLRYNFRKSPK